jgi:hypothetical protein
MIIYDMKLKNLEMKKLYKNKMQTEAVKQLSIKEFEDYISKIVVDSR